MKKSVVAIGNFDGVHLGHQDVLRHARMLADKGGYEFCALTFSPHPRQVFQPNIAPFRLSPDAVKQDLFNALVKPDRYEVLDFTTDFQHQSASAFIDSILIERLNAAIVIVGRDFHFGYKRSGNLQTLLDRPEFKTVSADLIEIGGAVVSSTRVRAHLKAAEIEQANALMGWEWYIQSEVVHGDKRGRELGYPTANMHFGETLVPAHGIYAVKIQIEGSNEWLHGAANIGIRPMFELREGRVEAHLLDFPERDLYGKTLRLRPAARLRSEAKFSSLKALIAQMDEDCMQAREILS